ncbi:DEAD/DEAH box helicase [Acaryochloris marina]|uniref:DEAD/DEAH box helicase n=1 Tax=Acaryochloris marina TaxID=155978 RepID=UPI001BAF28B3|nr:DEAD/DEAH box helicase [Acaryochloris marina]QUY40702.1 DEAD/DEAH box helicase [Acaryochloris marina S15]
MKIIHGTWIPDEAAFIQKGAFYLWVETTEPKKKRKTARSIHPFQLASDELEDFLSNDLGVKPGRPLEQLITSRHFLLPSTDQAPLPSLELARYLEETTPETFEWQYWQVDCFEVKTWVKTGQYEQQPVTNIIKLLNELHFIALHNLADMQLGTDLLFWYHYTQTLKPVLLKDQYIPALRRREVSSAKGSRSKSKSQKKTQSVEIYPAWEIVSESYETELDRFVDYMPLACVSGFTKGPKSPTFYDRKTLLRHFSEHLLTEIITATYLPSSFTKKIASTLLEDCLQSQPGLQTTQNTSEELYEQWRVWRDRIRKTQTSTSFYLCFQLQDPPKPEEAWQLQFLVAPKQDPSLQISLLDYWRFKPEKQQELQKQLGESFEQHLLLGLGYAARIYPQLWQGLETDQPIGIPLEIGAALDFLQESAWVLENAGYKVIVPAWWTPKGRQRAKIKLRAKGKSLSSTNDKSKSYFSQDRLVEYKYDLAIGDQKVSEQEWLDLVQAKSSLVQFRGQWMHLDQDKMQQMLEFWKTQQAENPDMTLLDFMRMTAEGGDDIEVDFDRDKTLSQMLKQLQDKSKLDAIADPETLQGTLREYQKRGVSWLHYLEQLGLNGCLADDMGLGKTVQVIARLAQEREQTDETIPPTLLIAPTSVVGNWRREIQKFAPHLQSIVHHGNERAKAAKDFKAMADQNDVIITSFSLARRDSKLFDAVPWHRIVLDEAQNIKNPKAAQTKAILKLSATHRLALTGTPVENRLLDLWSIFNFLNPGYLGKQNQFRKNFELPIQKDNNRRQSTTLKKLVEPFILRRLKTDKSIIKDLPDKVEQKLYCNLTKEQASLYEAVVKDISTEIDEVDGIQRKGMILSTLLKLKQICNHPRQFLQDESDFTPERSHKLSRLTEMITEVMEEGESLLVFTQFTELGDALEKYLRQTHHYTTYYIHGGTNRNKREQMITEFQDPETGPSVFILSLKAGGVGITLTKANHVFHFDRWWNPAVEDQATDRAFRIGQKKNVFVHKFVAIGTLEERIDEMIEDKKKLAGAIVGSDESWLTELDNESFKKLISLNKSAILE